MNIDLLQTFILVAKEGGFRSAAEKHFLTPSAVSSRIRLLEDEIGARLFERGQFGTRLTLSGQRLLDHAEEMLASWNRVRRDVAIPTKPQHPLAIGATDTIWQTYLLDVLSTMHNLEPTLSLRMETGTSESLIREVLDGSLDAIYLFEPPVIPVLQTKVVGEVPLTLVASKPNVSAVQAQEEWMIDIDWGREWSRQGADSSSMVRTSVGWIGLQWLIRHGGCAHLPETLAPPHIESGKLFKVSDAPSLTRTIHMIFPVQSESQNIGTTEKLLQLAENLREIK